MNSSLSGTGRPNCHRGHCRNLTLRCQRPLTSLSVSSFPPQSDRSGSEVGHKLFYLCSGSEVSHKLFYLCSGSEVSHKLFCFCSGSEVNHKLSYFCSGSEVNHKLFCLCSGTEVEISKPRNSINPDHVAASWSISSLAIVRYQILSVPRGGIPLALHVRRSAGSRCSR